MAPGADRPAQPGGDHYAVLGITSTATAGEVRKAWVEQARRYHPDRQGDASPAQQAAARQRMVEVNAAYAVLGDVERRAAYDAARSSARSRTRQGFGGGTGATSSRGPQKPPPPKGPGWRPLADDTAWMEDFDAWRAQTDRPDAAEDEAPGPTRPLAVLPVALFVVGILCGCLALVTQSRALYAGAFVFVIVSGLLFVLLPLLSMTRGGERRR